MSDDALPTNQGGLVRWYLPRLGIGIALPLAVVLSAPTPYHWSVLLTVVGFSCYTIGLTGKYVLQRRAVDVE